LPTKLGPTPGAYIRLW